MSKKNLIGILLIIFVYVVATGISYSLFSRVNNQKKAISVPLPSSIKSASGVTEFSQSLPKTEVCPLSGVLYSKPQEQWWETHRPLGVMIENHVDARPQSGLSSADVIYEAVAEGGITRFLAIFYCNDAGEIGPIRSARTYFIDFASEYGNYPLYAHVGGANQPGPANALGQLDTYGWTGYNDLNQFSIGFPVFWRDYNRVGHTVATEHTMYSTVDKLWDYAKTSRKLTNVDENGVPWNKGFIPYSYTDDAPLSSRPASQLIHLEFWAGGTDYYVDWAYDRTLNLYKRSNGGVPHIDFDTKQQLTAKNIVVLLMVESGADDGYVDNDHLLFQDLGSGNALIFKDGVEVKGTWEKDSRTSKTLIFDVRGNAVKFDRGLTWFEVLPTTGVVSVK